MPKKQNKKLSGAEGGGKRSSCNSGIFTKIKIVIIIGAAVFGAVFLYFGGSFFPVTYNPSSQHADTRAENHGEGQILTAVHLPTPDPLKALYMTSWVAGTPSLRAHIVRLIEVTEANAIVIDIKDYSGKVAFSVSDPRIVREESIEERVSDMEKIIVDLHARDIYVIGRISVFQDPHYAPRHPNEAVQRASDGTVWKDRKGLSFVDPGAKEYWDYIIALAEASYVIGFDEINFDYIRFPSDGNMKDIRFPRSDDMIKMEGKAAVMRSFFSYLHEKLKNPSSTRKEPMVISADLFGITMVNSDDHGIGQVLEYATPYFDYIAPMVYPSHYPVGFNGWKDPNDYPYDVVKYSLDSGVVRLIAASTSPLKIRPWLQDFDYGGDYGEKEVRAQIQATYDAGLTSWMLWDPANKYTPEALNRVYE